MYKNYLAYICCPDCKTDLDLQNDVLVCSGCNTHFEIKEEIPILIDKSKINKHLLHQIEYFEQKTNDIFNEYRLEEWQKNFLRRFLDNFNTVKDMSILDSGVGSGYMSIELAKLGAHVVASDLTLKNLIQLKKVASDLHLLDRITFVCCSSEELPFKSKTFDYVISNAILEHLPKEKEAIDEIKRVSKDVAGLMVTVPLSYKYLNPILLPMNFIHDKSIGHLRRYDEEILVRKFKGFQLIKTYYTGHSKKAFKWIINQFIKNTFNEDTIEQEDKKQEDVKFFASNIISFFKR